MSTDGITEAHINALVDELEKRDTWSITQTFLRLQTIPHQERRSWRIIRETLLNMRKDVGLWPIFSPKLERFISDIYLFGTKRVFLLSDPSIDPMSLAEEDPTKNSLLGFYDNEIFDRPRNHVGYHFKKWAIDDLEIYTFVTTRRAYENQTVPTEALDPKNQSKFDNSIITARIPKLVRTYDHVIKHADFSCLLIDQPGNLDRALVSTDALRYEAQLHLQATDKKRRPFVDLFPALKLLYLDFSDGIVNYIDSLSNESAALRTKYNHNSAKDLRNHPVLVEARIKNLQVDPFTLGLRWSVHSENPSIFLAGDKDMAEAATGQMFERRPLEFMTLPGHMSALGFLHVINRILHQLAEAQKSTTAVVAANLATISSSESTTTDMETL